MIALQLALEPRHVFRPPVPRRTPNASPAKRQPPAVTRFAGTADQPHQCTLPGCAWPFTGHWTGLMQLDLLGERTYLDGRLRVHGKARKHRQGRRCMTISGKQAALRLTEQQDLKAMRRQFRRPQVRGDCLPGGFNASRPCPWATCRYSLLVDRLPNGAIRFPFPDRDPRDFAQTCVLDVADLGGQTLDEVGEISNDTPKRIHQLERSGFRKAQFVLNPDVLTRLARTSITVE